MTKMAKRMQGGATLPVFGKVLEGYNFPDVLSLGDGVPDKNTFPVTEMAECAQATFKEALDDLAARADVFSYGANEGQAPLVEIFKKRYMKGGKYDIGDPEKDDLFIFAGATQLVDICAKVYCDPGDVILCEENTYFGSLDAFRGYEVKCVGVKCDEDGFIPEALEEALKANPTTKIIYTIDTFQNPMGIQTSLERRQAIYDLAVKYDTMVLEDGPYFELRYSGQYIPSIKSLDKDGRVIFSGSMSKIISPGVRVGFGIGAKDVMAAIGAQMGNMTMSSAGLMQQVVAKYFANYDVDKHIQDCCDLYRGKRDHMLEALERELGGICTWTHPDGGLFIWITLPEGMSGEEVAVYMSQEKHVILYPASIYRPDSADANAIRVNFSVPDFEQIDECIKRLGEAVKHFMK